MIFKTKSPLGKQNMRVQEAMRQYNKLNNNAALYKPLKHPTSPFSHTFAKAKYTKDNHHQDKETMPALNRHLSEQLNLQCDEQLQLFDRPKRQEKSESQPQDNLICDQMLQIPKEQHEWLKKTYSRVYSIVQEYHLLYLRQHQKALTLQQQNYRLREQMRYYRMK